MELFKKLDDKQSKEIRGIDKEIKEAYREEEILDDILAEDEYNSIFGNASWYITSIFKCGEDADSLVSRIYETKCKILSLQAECNAIEKSNMDDYIKLPMVEKYRYKIAKKNNNLENWKIHILRSKKFLENYRDDRYRMSISDPQIVDFIGKIADLELKHCKIKELNEKLEYKKYKDVLSALSLGPAFAVLNLLSERPIKGQDFSKTNTLLNSIEASLSDKKYRSLTCNDYKEELSKYHEEMKEFLNTIDLNSENGSDKKKYMEALMCQQELKWKISSLSTKKGYAVNTHRLLLNIIRIDDNNQLKNAKTKKSVNEIHRNSSSDINKLIGTPINTSYRNNAPSSPKTEASRMHTRHIRKSSL